MSARRSVNVSGVTILRPGRLNAETEAEPRRPPSNGNTLIVVTLRESLWSFASVASSRP